MRKTTTTRKGKGKGLQFVGTRILGIDEDPDSLVREFMENKGSSRVYTPGNEMTEAFPQSEKKEKKGKEKEKEKEKSPQQLEEEKVLAYGNDKTSYVFDQDEFDEEMAQLEIDPSQWGDGCNHSMTCSPACRLYHDFVRPTRNHYHHDEGTTSYERTRFGRFVRVNANEMIRLCDDSVIEKARYPRDALYKEGWHHDSSCPLNCVRYHYEGPPERYTRSDDGTFTKSPDGRWLYDWVNETKAFIRVGPNDTSEPGDLISTSLRIDRQLSTLNKQDKERAKQRAKEERKKEKEKEREKSSVPSSPPSLPPFRQMTEQNLIDYFGDKIERAHITELVRRDLLSLQKPVESNEDGEGSRYKHSLLCYGDAVGQIGDALVALFEQDKGYNTQACINFSVDNGIEAIPDLVMTAMREIIAKDRSMNEDMAVQSLVLFLRLIGNEGKPLSSQIVTLVQSTLNELDFCDEIHLVLYANVVDEAGSGALPLMLVPLPIEVDEDEHFAKLVTSVLEACHDRLYKIESYPIAFHLNKNVMRQFVEYLLQYGGMTMMTEATALMTVLSELDRLLATIRSHYDALYQECPLFMNACKEEGDGEGRPLCVFHLATESRGSIFLFRSRYPCFNESILPVKDKKTRKANDALVSLCIDNDLAVPYFTFFHPRHMTMCVHIVTPVEEPKDDTKNKKKKKTKRDDGDDEDDDEPHMKKIKRNKNNKAMALEKVIAKQNIQTHQWIEDKEHTTRVTKVYSCTCPLEASIHYKRPCCSGKDCITDGHKYGTTHTRGYCTRQCRSLHEKEKNIK